MSTLISALFLILFGWVLMAPAVIPAVWRMLSRAGRNPALSLLLVIPYVGFLVCVLALQARLVRPRGFAAVLSLKG